MALRKKTPWLQQFPLQKSIRSSWRRATEPCQFVWHGVSKSRCARDLLGFKDIHRRCNIMIIIISTIIIIIIIIIIVISYITMIFLNDCIYIYYTYVTLEFVDVRVCTDFGV